MKKIITTTFFLALLTFKQNGLSQGFVNLNFESANLSAYGVGPAGVPTANAIPGWTAYIGTNPSATIVFNTVSTGGAAISILDTNNFGLAPIQGRYSIFFQGDYNPANSPGFTNSATIAQTGLVPVVAQSLTFWGDLVGVNVTFNGQIIPYTVIGSGSDYTIYGADISGLSGQTGTLAFTALENGGGMLDNIQFSSTAVPEPSAFALAALGGLAVSLVKIRQWRRVLA